MGDSIRFIHCSDIHLGANPYGIEERFEDMGRAFMQVVACAISEKVDFVLIAGDFFHQKNLNAKTLEQAVNLLEPLKDAGIPVYMTEGNHDMATYTNIYSWLDFLCQKEYIYLLKPDTDEEGAQVLMEKSSVSKSGGIYETDTCYIVGLGYPGATAGIMINKLSAFIPDNGVKPVIIMLHTGIDKFLTEGMGGLREEELTPVTLKSDYIALGHIHTRYDNKDMKYYNPGSIENVKIESLTKNKENREKGFYLVDLAKGTRNVETEFKKVDIRNSINIEVDITGLSSQTEGIVTKIKTEVDKIHTNNDDIILNIKLVGTLIDGVTVLDINALKKEVKTLINVIYIEILNNLQAKNSGELTLKENQTREEIDREVLLKLIENEGFDEKDAEKLLNIVMHIKEQATEGSITMDMQEGMDIKGLVEKYVEGDLL
ncbi:MAG: hypothetical protein A2Y18_00970 [Clostridiales bacterium GWD2_32_19]|nr:MAG: hypothetical protein A2Y18_00970 [Clostridiales bacterium GWD2_32_19]